MHMLAGAPWQWWSLLLLHHTGRANAQPSEGVSLPLDRSSDRRSLVRGGGSGPHDTFPNCPEARVYHDAITNSPEARGQTRASSFSWLVRDVTGDTLPLDRDAS